METLTLLANKINKISEFRGIKTNTCEKIAFINSKVSDLLQTYKDEKFVYDKEFISVVNQAEDREVFQKMYKATTKGSFECNLAEVIIRSLELASVNDINIDAYVKAKLRFNSLQPKIELTINSY